jgi:hypothetical protein
MKAVFPTRLAPSKINTLLGKTFFENKESMPLSRNSIIDFVYNSLTNIIKK